MRDKVPAKAKKAYAGPGRVLSFCRDDTRVVAHLRIILVYYRNSFHESARWATSSIVCRICVTSYFNPRPLRGGRPRTTHEKSWTSRFQSTPPCAGGDCLPLVSDFWDLSISIHAPLRGGRLQSLHYVIHPHLFQSTPPCAGGDSECSRLLLRESRFQSTPPCAGGDIEIKPLS